MESQQLLTSAQTTKLVSFHSSMEPGSTTYLNPSDPAHKNVIEYMLGAADRSDDDYPHLFRMLNTSGAYAAHAPIDKVHIVDAGKTEDGKAIAKVWARSSGRTMVSGGKLLVFDTDSGQLLTHGDNSNVRSGFISCLTDTDSAAPAGNKLSLLYLGHATDEDGSTRFFSFADTVSVGEGIQVNVIMPAANPTDKDITIAVARVPGSPLPPNVNYIFYEAQNETPDGWAYPIIPFKGWVGLSGSVDLASFTIANLTTSVFVNNANGPSTEIGRATQYTTDAKMIQAMSVGGAPNILQWEFPYDQNSYNKTGALVFNFNNMVNEVESCFYFAFNNIPFTDGTVSAPFYVCSIDTPGQHSVSCTQILNMYFYWHCVAKGTLVTLEDGTQKPIEELTERFRVKSGTNGESLAVWATVQGRHQSDPANGAGEIFRLVTANGKSIVASENHMVFMTPEKCRRICDLEEGDAILTEEGASTVASVEAIVYDDVFYGLSLGNAEEKALSGFPHNNAGYFTGGILSGDQEAMRHHCKEIYHDLEYMLPRIKSELHQDYRSALTQKRP